MSKTHPCAECGTTKPTMCIARNPPPTRDRWLCRKCIEKARHAPIVVDDKEGE